MGTIKNIYNMIIAIYEYGLNINLKKSEIIYKYIKQNANNDIYGLIIRIYFKYILINTGLMNA